MREAEPPVKDAVRLLKRLRWASVVLPLLLSGAAAFYDYMTITDNAVRQIDTSTAVLAEHAEKVLETADLVLVDVSARIKGMDWPEIRASEGLHEWFVQLTHQLPQLDSVFLAEPNGKISTSSRGFPMQPYDISHRDYFTDAQAGDAGIYVSQPFVGQMAGTLAFTASRRLGGEGFDGVVGVTLSPHYLENFFRTILESSDGGAAALQQMSGSILARYPDAPSDSHRVAGGSPVYRNIQAGIEHAVLRGRSSIDGSGRLLGYRRLERYPNLLVVLRVDDGIYLRPWYEHAGFLAILAVLTATLLFVATTAAMRRAEAERDGAVRLIEETRRREWAEEALQQVQKMEALGRLTGGVAHDFNNLLAAVLGSLELAALGLPPPQR
jgi:hypothetical protein